MLAMINDAKTGRFGYFDRCLYPSGSNIVIEAWGRITGTQTNIANTLLPAAQKLSDIAAGIW
jgi:hypothetical protein